MCRPKRKCITYWMTATLIVLAAAVGGQNSSEQSVRSDGHVRPDNNRPDDHVRPDDVSSDGHVRPDDVRSDGHVRPDANRRDGHVRPDDVRSDGHVRPDADRRDGHVRPEDPSIINNYQQHPMQRRRGNGPREVQSRDAATNRRVRTAALHSNTRKRRRRPILSAVEYIHDTATETEAPTARGRADSSRQRRSGKGGGRRRYQGRHRQALALWIDHQQVQQLSGYPMEIYVIREGRVLPYVLDPHFDTRLPIIPPEVSSFNFTWQGGRRKRYRYQMDNLVSEDRTVMADPTVSIPTKGRMPKKPKGFQIALPCAWNASGVAWFSVRLKLRTRNNRKVHGTPLNVRLRKRCHPIEPQSPGAACPAGYLGPNCSEALCYPHCMHGGVCSAPGRCSCPQGYHGRYCQGGICSEKCLNGGKCIQKDKCSCTRGFYGDTCQYSKCVVPCVNGGVCRGANKCRCPPGFGGQHCEVSRHRGGASVTRCQQRCRLGSCDDEGQCHCQEGYTGRWCRRRSRDDKKRVWL